MADHNICVIGAGAIGLAAAHALVSRGAKVTILESQHAGAGSSGLSVGIIETQYFDEFDIALRARAMEHFARFEQDNGLDIVRNGYLRLVRDARSLSLAEQSVEVQRRCGVADASVLSPADVQALIPQMNCDGVLGGLFGPSDGFIDGHIYCALLAELITELGGEVMTRQHVRDVSTKGDRTIVHTDAGAAIECDAVVIAVGAWAAQLGSKIRVSMPVVAQRHEALVVRLGETIDYLMPSVMDYVPGSPEPGLYFRHERHDRLVAGLHVESLEHAEANPNLYFRGVGSDSEELMAERLAARLPGFPHAGLGGGWAGLFPMSIDGLPLLGPSTEEPSIFIAGGAGGVGIQIAPALGELLAEWILDGRPTSVPGAQRMDPRREYVATAEGA